MKNIISLAAILSSIIFSDCSLQASELSKIGNMWLDVDSNDLSFYSKITENLEIEPECHINVKLAENALSSIEEATICITYINFFTIKNLHLSSDHGSESTALKNILSQYKSIFNNKGLASFSSSLFKNVEYINDNFLSRNELEEINIPDVQNVKNIGNGFLNHNNLTEFSTENFTSLTSIGDHFLGNNNLTKFSADGFEKVTSVGELFLYNNKKLKEVDLRGFKSIDEIGDAMFEGCYALKEIIVSKENEDFFSENLPNQIAHLIVVK